MLMQTHGAQGVCPKTGWIKLAGNDLNDIPKDLGQDVTMLFIANTNISVLNLTMAVEYPAMCLLDVRSSPVSSIITPIPPQTVALIFFRLLSGRFPVPPDLGSVVTNQLQYLSFNGLGITTIPDNYFQNFRSLITLNLIANPITNIEAGSLAGLGHLGVLYLDHGNYNPVPPLHLWLPNLRRLHLTHIGMTLLPVALIENLPFLRVLYLKNNHLSTVPSKDHFVNLENMQGVYLAGNPLRCDSGLIWIKVMPRTELILQWCKLCNRIVVYWIVAKAWFKRS